MTVRSTARKEFELTSSMWLDSGAVWPIAYVDDTWKKLGVDVTKMPMSGDVKYERLIDFRVAALDLGPAVGVSGAPQLEDKLKQIDIDVAGGLGMGFLSGLRVTVAEQGRALWLETDEGTSAVLNPQNLPAAKPTSTATPEPATTSSAAPKPTTSAAPTTTAAPKPTAATSTPAPKGK
jgi:cell division septation protein DedD